MPVNVRRYCTSVLFAIAVFAAASLAQTQPPQNTPAETQPTQTPVQQPQTVPIKAPSAAEIMRDRISKAKAFIVVRNYNAAIYELDNIRRETSDSSVQAVTTVLLMNSYLEQGDYKRAQDFLTQAFNTQKTNRPGSVDIYNSIAAQVIKGSRTKVERYRSLGLMVADRNLPLEAVADIERMRETVELVIAQSKEMGKDASKMNVAMAMLEEASASRSALARDDYDARKWRDEVADSRETLANSRSVITNAVDGTTSPNVAATQTSPAVQAVALNQPLFVPPAGQPGIVAANKTPDIPVTRERVTSTPPPTEAANRPSNTLVAANEKPALTDSRPAQEEPKAIVVQGTVPDKPIGPAAESVKNEGPMDVGSLIDFATKRTSPVYPSAARSMRAMGVVRVDVTVDESGEVAEVQRTSGPLLLQSAAKDAVRKWKFKPFIRDGQPVRAIGFVNFNFAL